MQWNGKASAETDKLLLPPQPMTELSWKSHAASNRERYHPKQSDQTALFHMSGDRDTPATNAEQVHGMSFPPQIYQMKLLPISTVNKYDCLNKLHWHQLHRMDVKMDR